MSRCLLALALIAALSSCYPATSESPGPIAPIDDPAASTVVRGSVAPRAGATGTGQVFLLQGATRQVASWSANGAFDFAQAPSGRIKLVFNDGEGHAALLDLVVQPRGINDVGAIDLVPAENLPELLALRGIGFEERLTNAATDLIAFTLHPDGNTVYGSRNGSIVRVDLGTEQETVIDHAAGHCNFHGTATLSLLDGRYLVGHQVARNGRSIPLNGQRTGTIYDLAVHDTYDVAWLDEPVTCQRKVLDPGHGETLLHAWAYGGKLLAVVASVTPGSGGAATAWLGSLVYTGEEPFAKRTGLPESIAASDAAFLGDSSAGPVLRVGNRVLRAKVDTAALELLGPFAGTPLRVVGDELVTLGSNATTLSWYSLDSAAPSRPALDLSARLAGAGSFLMPVPLAGEALLVFATVAYDDRDRLATRDVLTVDPTTQEVRALSLEFEEAGKRFAPTGTGGFVGVPGRLPSPRPGVLRFVMRTEVYTDGFNPRAVIDVDGAATTGRFLTSPRFEDDASFTFSLLSSPDGALEVRQLRDDADHLQVFAAPAGSASGSFRQRTWVSADHAHLVFTPDSTSLLSLVRDPVGGHVQLFRLKW